MHANIAVTRSSQLYVDRAILYTSVFRSTNLYQRLLSSIHLQGQLGKVGLPTPMNLNEKILKTSGKLAT